MRARVLVVDDDDHVRRAIAVMFARAGFEVDTADDGEPACTMTRDGHYDLVVVDFHMRTVRGDEVVRQVKERHGATTYCAVLTASDDEVTRKTCRAAGADAFFAKPTRPSLLKHQLIAAVPALRAGET
jgi:DNA-binding response OmpR family regulator